MKTTFKEKHVYSLPDGHHRVKLECSGPGEIVVSVDGHPIWTQSQNIKKTLDLGDASNLEIRGQKGQTYGLSIIAVGTRPDEDHDELDPYRKPPKRTAIGRARDELRRQMNLTREHFLDLEGDSAYPGYEVDDDDLLEWEEEMADAQSSKANALDDPKPKDPDPEDPNPKDPDPKAEPKSEPKENAE